MENNTNNPEKIKTLLKTHFPLINDRALIDMIADKCSFKQVEAGVTLMYIGNQIRMMPLVTEGAIKVMREDDEGEDLLLYFLNPGETCAVTVNCCTANKPSEIKAVVEEDCSFISVPIEYVSSWIEKYPSWRNFIFNTYGERFTELLNALNSIAFLKMDERLRNYMKDKSQITNSKNLNITHQEIADDLHSSREVISRLLKKFEINGEIELGRNKITLL